MSDVQERAAALAGVQRNIADFQARLAANAAASALPPTVGDLTPGQTTFARSIVLPGGDVPASAASAGSLSPGQAAFAASLKIPA